MNYDQLDLLNHKRGKGYVIIFIFTSLFFLTACQDGERTVPASGNETPTVLTVGFEGDAHNLDPHQSLLMANVQVFAQSYDTLVRMNEHGEVIPVLATDWQRYDDFSYTFYLQQGVKFHDGSTLTAADVVFSLSRGAQSPAVGAIMGVFDPERIYALDDYTVRVGTFEHFAPLVETLTHPAASILSYKAYTAGVDFANEMVGTGAFKMVERNAGDFTRFFAFAYHHGGGAGVDELLVRPVVELNARMIGLEAGEIDIANLTRTNIPAVEANDNLQMITRDTYQIFYFGINVERVTDARVRQAINYAINTEEIHEVLLYGQGVPLSGPLSSEVFGYHPQLAGFAFNPERAKALLAEAGYNEDNPLQLTLVTNEMQDRIEWALAAQNNLQAIGVQLEIFQYENAIFLEETSAGNYDMFVLAWTTVTGDADYGLFPLFHSSNHGSAGNRTFFSDERVDALLELARSTFDQDIRLASYKEVQEILQEEAPMVFLSSGSVMMATGNHVQGFMPTPTGVPLFYPIYFD